MMYTSHLEGLDIENIDVVARVYREAIDRFARDRKRYLD